MYIASAEKKGIPPHKLRGSVSSDALGEYIARKAYIFPPRDAMRLTVDVMEYCLEHMPHLNYFATAYIVREAGSTLIQECAFGLAMAMANLEAAVERGIDIDAIAPKWSFIFAIHMNLFEEVAKFRALRRLWAKIMKEKFGAKEPSSWRLRVGPGTGAVTLPAQQPENNIIRVTLEALAGALGGVQYLHTSAFDEAYATPTERSVKLALRTQQILAYESGVANVVDPLGGSYYIEALTEEIENAVLGHLKEIEKMGGIVKAIESGWVQDQIDASAYQYQKEIEEGKRIVVGVNKFCTDEQMNFQIHRGDPKGMKIIQERLQTLKRERNEKALMYSLAKVREAAQGTENLMPLILEAVKNYATMGEICGVLKEVFGEYRGAIHI
jgi:methylmalonyl-CoA mutase N-terminal domain/subunit